MTHALPNTEPDPAVLRGRDGVTTPLDEREVLARFRGAPGAWLDVGHSRLAYRRFGAGPDLVFVHGWPLHSATFRQIVPRLTSTFTCHLFDLPGTGQTDSDAGAPIELGSHAATVRRAIDVLGLGHYALVAHDSGGFIARHVAADDPRAIALVLGNTEIPGHHPWLVSLLVVLSRMPGGQTFIRSLISSRAIRRSPLGFSGCFADLRFIEGDFHELFVAPLLESPRSAEGQIHLLRTLRPGILDALPSVHARIRAPVRLVWGADDPFFPLPKAERMLDQFGGRADLRVIPGAKLLVHEERPDEFVAHAKPFLLEAFAAAETASTRV